MADFGGLLEFIKTPEGQGLLSGVMGGMAGARQGTPWNNLGRGGVAGLMGYGGALDRQTQTAEAAQMQKSRDMTLRHQQMQMDKAEADAAKEKAFSSGIGKYFIPGSPAEPAQAGWQGFTPIDSMLPPEFRVGSAPTAAKPAVAPSIDMQGLGLFMARNGRVKEGLELLNPPSEEYTLGEGQTRYKGTKIIAQGQPKPDGKPTKVQEYEYAKANGYKGTLEQYVSIGPTIMAGAAAPLRNAQIANIEGENAYNLPAPRPTAGSPVSVAIPGGRTMTFPNAAAANSFKMKAGIK